MIRDRVRAFSTLKYYDPGDLLIGLRDLEQRLATMNDLPVATRHLRTHELKLYRELREACLFCYGWNQINGTTLAVAPAEAQDFDAVASSVSDEQILFTPIQVKEVVPEHLNASASVQTIVDSLTKYADSADLTVVIHLNRRTQFRPDELTIPRVNVAAIWVLAALSVEQDRWAIWGNFLESWRCAEFKYPEHRKGASPWL